MAGGTEVGNSAGIAASDVIEQMLAINALFEELLAIGHRPARTTYQAAARGRQKQDPGRNH